MRLINQINGENLFDKIEKKFKDKKAEIKSLVRDLKPENIYEQISIELQLFWEKIESLPNLMQNLICDKLVEEFKYIYLILKKFSKKVKKNILKKNFPQCCSSSGSCCCNRKL